MKPILITSYVNPDLDGVAGIVAYAEFLQKTERLATVGILGQPHEEAEYVLKRFNIPFPSVVSDSSDYDEVVLVDTSEPQALHGHIELGKVIEVIDHRKVHRADAFPNARVQVELVGSAATLIAERFFDKQIEMSRESAVLICGAIISNTLNFKATVTTDRDRNAFARLNSIAQLGEDFWKELFLAKSDMPGGKLKERIEGDFVLFTCGEKKMGIAQIEMIGAKVLIEERGEEIVQILQEIQQKEKLDYIFQNTIELEESKNYFVSPDEKTRVLLEQVLEVSFQESVAVRANVLMRKQIVPLLKSVLESA